MTTLYRAAIGPVNAERYLPRFARFDAMGRTRPGWNWAAFACTLNWMALRHLWSAALVYVAAVEGLALLVFGVARPMLQWPDAVQWGLIAVFAALAFLLPGLYGDAVLHTEIRKRIARALAATRTIPEACAQLGRQASSWKRLIGLALLNLVLVGAASAAYWYLPQGSLSGQPPAPPDLPAASAPTSDAAAAPAPAPAPASAPTPMPAPEPVTMAAAPATTTTSAAAAAKVTQETPAPASLPEPQATPAPTTAPTTRAARLPESSRAVPRRPPAAKTATPTANSTAASTANGPSEPASAPPPEVGKAPGYYINVGLFAEEANARKAQARLLNEGLPAFRQTLETAKGKRIRVRVGPYPTAKQANAAATQIRGLKLEAVVFKQ